MGTHETQLLEMGCEVYELESSIYGLRVDKKRMRRVKGSYTWQSHTVYVWKLYSFESHWQHTVKKTNPSILTEDQ